MHPEVHFIQMDL